MKSSLREKKRIKEDARHPPPVRRWLSFSAAALSQCEAPHFYSCCATEWLQEAVQLGTSVRKLILSMWLPRLRELPCMPHSAAKPETPSHAVKQDITQRKISILHWLGHYLEGTPARLCCHTPPHLAPMTCSCNCNHSSSVPRGLVDLPSVWVSSGESSTILPLLTQWCWFLQSCTKFSSTASASLLLWLLLAEFPFLACWKTLSLSITLDNDDHNSGLKPCGKYSPDATVQVRQLQAARTGCFKAAHSANSAAGFREDAILKQSHQAGAQRQYVDCGKRHMVELLLKNC